MSEEKRRNSKKELNVSEKSEDNFGEPSKNQERRLGYNSIKTISFFPSNSYLCFEIYFKEIKTSPFKGREDGMTWDKHENMESFQGSATGFQGPPDRVEPRVLGIPSFSSLVFKGAPSRELILRSKLDLIQA
ncbi:hypothetical protein M9H77_20908 [Catharanthus roseus]|uniref:Uncharacterized protein n=1 Tax=Catharanthus roseus TaxID=4058 RepID=A0ACC0AL22_CATRO|nr:hypothetical protein M9H77_20908 [Catharanthus roseus]